VNQQRALMLVVIVGLSLAAASGIVMVATGGPGGGNSMAGIVTAIIVVAALLAALLSMVGLLVMRSRRVRGAVEASRVKPADAAARLGLAYQSKGAKSLRQRFSFLPEVKRGGTTMHVLTGRLGERALIGFQDRFFLQTGQGTIPIEHTIYATEAPSWPMVRIQAWGVFDRLMHRFGRVSSVEVESDAFNRAFRVIAEDEAFAVTLLSPEMQEFLLEKSRGARWRIERGHVCLVYTGKMAGSRVEASIDRMARFWSHVAPELEGWSAGGAHDNAGADGAGV
jgi:hypothetical protein